MIENDRLPQRIHPETMKGETMITSKMTRAEVEAILDDGGNGPFKTNKFRRDAKAAIARLEPHES